MSIHHATTSCPITHPHVFSIRPPCFLHVSWCHIFNLRYTCAHHVYTMRNSCPLTLFLTLAPSRLFPILLDRSRLYHMTSRSHAYLLYLFSCCRLIIITTIYTCPNPNPSSSLSILSSYNISRISSRDYKKTQQRVLDTLLFYLYNRYIVYASNK